MGNSWLRVLNRAIDLAYAAGDQIEVIRRQGFEESRKADNSIVTTADLASDQILVEGLRRAFPSDAVLSEESGMTGDPNAERIWVVDPLDGTRGFVAAERGYSVIIGLLEKGEPVLGVVFEPGENRLFYGALGEGAYIQEPGWPAALRREVSTAGELSEMRVALSASMGPERRQALVDAAGMRAGPALHGAGVKAALVAVGEAEVYFSGHPLHWWDTVGPQAIAREAGARSSLLDGTPVVYTSEAWEHPIPLLVTNDTRHDEILAAIRSYSPPTEAASP